MVETKLFLQMQSINVVYPNEDNMIAVSIIKRMEIITSIEVWPNSWVNINYKENCGKKAFLAIPKHQYHLSQWGEHDYSANNKRNGDYYGYPSLSHFTDEL